MSSASRSIIELMDRPWSELTAEERQLFEGWPMTAQGVDLYLLLDFARARWRRERRSSSATFQAVLETAQPKEG